MQLMPVKNPISAPAIIELDNFLPYRLTVVAEAVSAALARSYQTRYDISIPEWRIIATLGEFTTMTATEIGRHSRMHKTKVSRAIASLREKNMVERIASTKDLRKAAICLTGAGREVYDTLAPDALAFAESLFAGASDDERALLETMLRKLEQRALASTFEHKETAR